MSHYVIKLKELRQESLDARRDFADVINHGYESARNGGDGHE